MNLVVPDATSAGMKKINVAAAPREIGSVFDWIVANLEGLALGALIAAGIVGLMMMMRWVGHRIVAADPENFRWKGIIGRVLSKTTVLL